MFSSTFAGKATVNAKEEFQQGPNVSRTAAEQIYGWFVGQIQSICPDKTKREVLSAYQCPTIVMVGSESTGKSSTIENITKVPIFPTAKGICTRCPIKVSLFPEEKEAYTVTFRKNTQSFNADTKGSLKACIAKIFDEIASCPAGYTNDEITVTIERKDVMRMDIVDLPGIVAYPQPAKDFTSALSLKYIQNKNNFLLCVANATIPRLTSYEPIARIIESGACERSVVVLTMIDKLEPTDYDTCLINRILGESDELRAHKFSACCAVINRSNTTSFTLEEQTVLEKSWFDDNIIKVLRNHGGKQQKDYADKIEANAGINNLLVQVNKKFEEYIKTLWVPQTIKEIDNSVLKLQQSLKQLGDPVTNANIVAWQPQFQQLEALILKEIFSLANYKALFFDQQNAAVNVSFITTDYIVSQISNWISVWKFKLNFLFDPRVGRFVEAAPHVIDPPHVTAPYRFQRFSGLFEDYKKALQKQINDVVAPYLRRLDGLILSNQFTNPQANVQLLTSVISTLVTAPWVASKLGPQLHVGMKEDCADERARLEAHIKKHEEVKRLLKEKV
jgi:GTPase SAR1 family protein